jgi:acetolactate synthase-1/2/3 large subunit
MPAAPPPPRAADLVANALARAGARTAFAASARVDAGVATLMEAAPARGLRVVEAGQGAAACVMASVTGLLTDAPGVALVELDEAEPEIRAALEQAARDAAPLVLVTDRAFSAPAAPVAKAGLVVSADSAAHWSAHAAQLALTDPRGPVHLVMTAETAVSRAVPVATAVRPAPLVAPASAVLDRAADFLAQARRPILVAGRQCRTLDSAAWLRALAEAVPTPVLVTTGGKGALPDPHPLSLGLAQGTTAAVALLARADLAVLVGLDAEELSAVALPPALPILRLSASGADWPGHPSRMDVVGEIALLIAELAPRLRGRERADWDVAELDRIKRAVVQAPTGGWPGTAAVVRTVREAVSREAVAVIAAGKEMQSAVAAWQTVAPGQMVVPTPPELRGFAGPAAIAAATARSKVRVVCFASLPQILDSRDALALAARLALPVLVVVIGESGGSAMGSAGDLAAGCAWTALEARDEMRLRAAIERSLAAAGPALIDARPRPTV